MNGPFPPDEKPRRKAKSEIAFRRPIAMSNDSMGAFPRNVLHLSCNIYGHSCLGIDSLQSFMLLASCCLPNLCEKPNFHVFRRQSHSLPLQLTHFQGRIHSFPVLIFPLSCPVMRHCHKTCNEGNMTVQTWLFHDFLHLSIFGAKSDFSFRSLVASSGAQRPILYCPFG